MNTIVWHPASGSSSPCNPLSHNHRSSYSWRNSQLHPNILESRGSEALPRLSAANISCRERVYRNTAHASCKACKSKCGRRNNEVRMKTAQRHLRQPESVLTISFQDHAEPARACAVASQGHLFCCPARQLLVSGFLRTREAWPPTPMQISQLAVIGRLN